MLSKDNFTKENIQRLQKMSGNDPSLLEKTVYAFGLLEAIAKVGMPFIFKGGTCLMLLLDKPQRLSTDIDIIVAPGTDVDHYIQMAGQVFPFISQKEDVRAGSNDIEKRHYEFSYNSPVNDKPLVILLDIVFEDNHYKTLLVKPIQNELLLTEGENLEINIPDVNSILGDKLTAFAPHTTGINFGIDKELEIIKQLYDCCTLLEKMTDFAAVADVYKKVVETELAYRGLSIDAKEVSKDTIKSCLCIISRGALYKDDYGYFSDGIRKIGGHIFADDFNGEVAAHMACKLLYLAACLACEIDYPVIRNPEEFLEEKLIFAGARRLNYIRKTDTEAYAYLVSAIKVLGDEIDNILAE